MVTPESETGGAPLSVVDRLAIVEAVTGIGLYTDLRDWPHVALFLADDVTTDYVAVFGGEVTTTARTKVIEQWRNTLQALDATQHQITNSSVTGAGDEAVVLSHFRATHWLRDRSWTLGGVYTHRLSKTAHGWQVTFMGIRRLYEEGDRSVL